MEPLFRLAEKDFETARLVIDNVFSEYSPAPATIETNSIHYFNLSQAEYDNIDSVINKMIKDFKNNKYDITTFVEQWEKKLYIRDQYKCIIIIAEKCYSFFRQ